MIDVLIKVLLGHPKKILGIALLVTVLLAYFIPEIRMVTSVDQLFPSKSDPDRQTLEKAEYLFGEDPTLIVVLETDTVFRPATLEKIKALAADIEKVDHVVRVDSLANSKRVISTAEEMRSVDFLEEIPVDKVSLKALETEYFENPLYRNAYVSEDRRWAVLNIVMDPTEKMGHVPPIVREIRALVQQYEGPERIFLSGMRELNTAFNDLMRHDRRQLVPLVALIMLIVLYLNFRSLIGFSLPLLSVLIGVLWTFGIMSLFKIPVSILTSALPSILIAIGCSYAIYFLAAYYSLGADEMDPVVHVRKTLNRTLLAVIFCSFTTIVGFFGLWLNDIELIHHMGVAACIGIASLLALTAFVLPCFFLLVGLFQKKRQTYARPKRVQRYPSWIENIPRGLIKHSRTYLLIWVLLVGFGLVMIPQLKIENDPSTFFKEDSIIRLNLQSLIEDLNMYGRFKVIVSAEEADFFKRPDILRRLEKIEQEIQEDPRVGKIMSLPAFIKTVNKSFNEQNPEHARIPDTSTEVAQYLLLYDLSGDHETVYQYVTEDYQTTQLALSAGVTSSRDSLELGAMMLQACEKVMAGEAECRVSGTSYLLGKSARYIALGVLKGFSLALAVIMVLMFFLFRSVKIGFVAMLPNIAPTILLLGTMATFGIPLNVGTSIILTIALGIAVDDTLHFFVHYYHELKQSNHFLIQQMTGIQITEDQKWAVVHTWRHLFTALIATSATIICGFLVLMLSDLTPLALFGGLTALTMFFALLTDLTLTPVLLLRTKF